MSAALSPAVVFRRRSGWEASDMGIFLWRTNWLPLFLFIGVPAGVIFAADWILSDLEIEWVTTTMTLFIWWLKPFLDRFCLHVVSVRFFEPRAPLRRLFRGLGKTLRTGLAGDLLWRRLSPFRSARMPLRVLERQNRKNYNRRKQLLTRNGLGFGLALTAICTSMLLVLNFGELVFLYGITNEITGSSGSILDFIGESSHVTSPLFYINLILVETLYVCMGFSLYINARVETEGWDIELLFKEYVEKEKRRTVSPVKQLGEKQKQRQAVPALALIFLLAAGQVQAQTPSELQPVPVSEETHETLDRIFDSPDFGKEKPGREIQFKRSDTRNTGNGFRFEPNAELTKIMGMFLRFVLGAALAAALAIGAVYAYRHRGLFPGAGGKSRLSPGAVPDEPRQLLEQAEEFHRKGKIREAWALCFRAFIAAFTQVWYLSFPAEATEYESLALVRRTLKSGAAGTGGTDTADKTTAPEEGFAAFVRRWIGFAYGGREPAAGNFEEALVSCRSLLETTREGE